MTNLSTANLEPTVTIMTKTGGPMTKTISLGSDSKVVSDGSACRMWSGTAHRRRLDLPDPHADLVRLINGMGRNQALVLGDTDSDGKPIDVWTRKAHEESAHNCEIGKTYETRTKDRFRFFPRPGVMLIDVDMKGMPDRIARRLTGPEGILALLDEAAPGLSRTKVVWRASTSSNLVDTRTGQSVGVTGGYHLYVLVADATDIPDALRRLHNRLWLKGYGFIRLGVIGQMLDRSVVDVFVGSPERLIFEGPPIVEPPLRQDVAAREAKILLPGGAEVRPFLDTRSVVPVLSAAERDEVARLKAAERARLEPEASRIRESYTERETEKGMKKTGLSRTAARRVVEKRLEGRLDLLDLIELDDGTVLRVVDLLAEAKSRNEATMPDPVAGAAGGQNKAMFYSNWRSGVPIIFSHAHGGTIYRLTYGPDEIAEAIRKGADAEQVAYAARLKLSEVNHVVEALR